MGDPFVRPGVPCEAHVEQLVLKHPGTGHDATTQFEWMTQQHKDTLSSIVDRYDHLQWLAVAENTCAARMRFQLLNQMAQSPCGVAPMRKRPREE